ncbi:Chromodomain-helicase-DNA-binding 8 [Gossypium arboreum]|uniref:Chromodomain-helicase-DNA-binding 8 n=1 Tax=Gossypium arboreum TaxID=29729 RepID=A0A0B0NWV1_GOSAR|nr:Chromodomain-helicase-DNA-binding 8 [Gossypium arboreum]
MTTEVAEFMEKLKDKRKKYEAIASSDSSVSLDGIDNQTIIEVLGPETACSNTCLWGIKLKLKFRASREVEAQRKYEELQLQLKVEAAAREAEASRKYDELQLQL